LPAEHCLASGAAVTRSCRHGLVALAIPALLAADTALADPTPAEYAEACEAYGSGFVRIPGTETCVKVSGYVRGEYRFRD